MKRALLRAAIVMKWMLLRTPARRLTSSPSASRLRAWLVHRSTPGLTTMEVAGLELVVPVSFATHNAGGFERRSVAWVSANVQTSGFAVDVGAHVGVMTCLLANLVGSSGRVVAVEPDARNRRLLEANLELHSLSARVDVLGVAVGATKGVSNLLLHDNTDASHLVDAPGSKTAGVEVTTLDEICANRASPDFIKIDVEGWEPEVLAGMAAVLVQRPPILIEFNPSRLRHNGFDPADLIGTLEANGYEVTVLDDREGRERTVEELLRVLPRLPQTWYANLGCRA